MRKSAYRNLIGTLVVAIASLAMGAGCASTAQKDSTSKRLPEDPQIIAQHSGQCLDVTGVSTASGTSVIQWPCHGGANQQWRLVDAGGGYYNIVAQHSSQCLDVTGVSTASGTNVIQWSCHGGANQKWRLVDAGGGYYNIVAQHSGQCLDVTGASTTRGANVIQWPCHGGANQRWRLVF